MFSYRSITMIEGNSSSEAASLDLMLGGVLFPRQPFFLLFNQPVRIKVSLRFRRISFWTKRRLISDSGDSDHPRP